MFCRAAIEYEKKGYSENYEQGQVMENNLISMAREVEKLRAEVANAEKRARATAAVGNQGGCHFVLLLFSILYVCVFFQCKIFMIEVAKIVFAGYIIC